MNADTSDILLTIYLAGVLIGIALIRDRWPARLGLALVWPLGPIAFIVVVAMLLVAAAILWPILLVGATALIGVAAWFIM
jgi:hypothetical protein